MANVAWRWPNIIGKYLLLINDECKIIIIKQLLLYKMQLWAN